MRLFFLLQFHSVSENCLFRKVCIWCIHNTKLPAIMHFILYRCFLTNHLIQLYSSIFIILLSSLSIPTEGISFMGYFTVFFILFNKAVLINYLVNLAFIADILIHNSVICDLFGLYNNCHLKIWGYIKVFDRVDLVSV